MISKKLKKARQKIDRVDKGIFKLIRKRSQIVKYMLSLKKHKKEIVDKKRINEILKVIKNNPKIANSCTAENLQSFNRKNGSMKKEKKKQN